MIKLERGHDGKVVLFFAGKQKDTSWMAAAILFLVGKVIKLMEPITQGIYKTPFLIEKTTKSIE